MNLQSALELPILKLLPHAPPMALLDRSVSITETSYEAEVTIRADSLLCESEGVPSWVGIEYMAQAIAAFAGAEALTKQANVKTGFLLGTREYRPAVSHFKVGSVLRVHVTKVIHDPGGLSVLECSLHEAGQDVILVQANITVYEVSDLTAYLKENAR